MSIILQKYGITLRRIEQSDIELLRQWRNNPDINKYMAYRAHITPEMQQQWFERVNTPLHYYLLIITEGKAVGVINTKNINMDEGFGEGGIFIWEQQYWRTYLPTLATLTLLEFTFDVLSDFDVSVARVMRDNDVAARYNRALGYVLIPEQYGDDLLYVLTRRKYKTKTTRLIRAAEKLVNDHLPVRYTIEHSPRNLPAINQLAQK